ncbi:DUF998 domain-containing protein [Amycolatopsis sp. lyj-109]|uniref:DUF998 domain-containing protein n=1 Tax=Amycolatopsis sp. lyj-109 TaxID=2789287 RepID=UPI0039796295
MNVLRTRLVLLAAGAAGPIAFVASYVVNGATQAGYSSWHNTISTLSLADHGWIQDTSFVLYGVLTLCFAEGLRRSSAVSAWGFALLALAGLGLLVIGTFRTDPILGFPPGQPGIVTPGGTIHSIGALVVFLAFPAAILVTAVRMSRGWAAFSSASGVLSLIAVALFFAAVSAANGHDGGGSPAGIHERLPTLFIGLWQIAFGLRVLARGAAPRSRRSVSPGSSPRHA